MLYFSKHTIFFIFYFHSILFHLICSANFLTVHSKIIIIYVMQFQLQFNTKWSINILKSFDYSSNILFQLHIQKITNHSISSKHYTTSSTIYIHRDLFTISGSSNDKDILKSNQLTSICVTHPQFTDTSIILFCCC